MTGAQWPGEMTCILITKMSSVIIFRMLWTTEELLCADRLTTRLVFKPNSITTIWCGLAAQRIDISTGLTGVCALCKIRKWSTQTTSRGLSLKGCCTYDMHTAHIKHGTRTTCQADLQPDAVTPLLNYRCDRDRLGFRLKFYSMHLFQVRRGRCSGQPWVFVQRAKKYSELLISMNFGCHIT